MNKALESKISILNNETDESNVIRHLKEIGEEIVTNYIIKIDKTKYLMPLWLEAYCFIPGIFKDDACDNKQTQYYSKSGLHFSQDARTKFIRRTRVDIVPPHDSSYALSYLLKLALLIDEDNKQILIQSEIAKLLQNAMVSLKYKPSHGLPVAYQHRVNLKGIFKDENLAICHLFGKYRDYERIRNNRKRNQPKWISEILGSK